MKRQIARLLLILGLLPFVRADEIDGLVTKVHDGDNITFKVGTNRAVSVRLSGIDAPELDQPFAKEARAILSALVLGSNVTVKTSGKDRYGRVLGNVYLGDEWINRALVARGSAWVYREYSKDEQLIDAEKNARTEKLGLWNSDAPTAPWSWRKSKKM